MPCTTKRILARLFTGSVLGVGGGAVFVHAGDPPQPPVLPRVWSVMLTRQAQAAVNTPMINQAANGVVLEQTLWYYHFNLEHPEMLHESGMTLLDRLARRQLDEGNGACLHLYVQRAHNHSPVPEPGATRTVEVDQKRFQAISQYLARVWPQMPYAIHVYDPHPIGMAGIEAAAAYKGHAGTSIGFIPEGFRIAASSSQAGAAGSGPATGGTLVPVSEPGMGGASSIGASAGTSSGGGMSQ